MAKKLLDVVKKHQEMKLTRQKTPQKLEDGKKTIKLDDFKGEKEKRMSRSTREEIKSATKQICSLPVLFGLYTIRSCYH